MPTCIWTIQLYTIYCYKCIYWGSYKNACCVCVQVYVLVMSKGGGNNVCQLSPLWRLLEMLKVHFVHVHTNVQSS